MSVPALLAAALDGHRPRGRSWRAHALHAQADRIVRTYLTRTLPEETR